VPNSSQGIDEVDYSQQLSLFNAKEVEKRREEKRQILDELVGEI